MMRIYPPILKFLPAILCLWLSVACVACPVWECDTPISLSASASPNPVCIGQTVTYNVTAADYDKYGAQTGIPDNVNISWDGGNPPTSFQSAGTYQYTVRVNDLGSPVQCTDPEVSTTVTVIVKDMPQVTIAKPACENEYVSGTVFIKAYVTDTDGIQSVTFLVDDIVKGSMLQESDYWRYDWDTSGTAKGLHTIKVEAVDTYGCEGEKGIDVYCHPVVTLSEIAFKADHTL